MHVCRFTCQFLGSLGSVDLYFWNKTVPDSCCLHCDGTVFKAGEVVETVVEEDDCQTVKSSVCRKNEFGKNKIFCTYSII